MKRMNRVLSLLLALCMIATRFQLRFWRQTVSRLQHLPSPGNPGSG